MLALASATNFYSCKPEECENEVPEITFKEFIQFPDSSGTLKIDFIDCDGDIGLTDADTFPPYDKNLLLTYFEMVDGQWEEIDLGEFAFEYRIPPITPDGQSKVLEGEIAVDINPLYFDPFSPNSDTVKFEVVLRDQAKNESNKVSTGTIIVPK